MEFQYRGLKGTLEHVEVTEKELDARLMQLQQQHPCVKVVTDRRQGRRVCLQGA